MLWKRKRELYRRGSIYCSDGSWDCICDPVSDLWHHDRCVLQADLQDRVFLMAEKEKKESGPIEELQKDVDHDYR